MPEIQLYPRDAAMNKATVVKTTLALSKLRLFKQGLVLTGFTTLAQLEAAECDFDGYTVGGYTLTAWTGPGFDGGGGAVITSPLTTVSYGPAGDPVVTNEVGGWFIETAVGGLWLAGTFDPARTLAVIGDSFPMVVQIVEAKNSPLPG